MDMVRSALFKQFADRYFPAADARADTAPGVDPKMAAEHARAMTGHYIASDRSASNFLAINSFRFPTVVEINEEGQLVIPSLTGSEARKSVGWGKRGSVRVDRVGGGDIKK